MKFNITPNAFEVDANPYAMQTIIDESRNRYDTSLHNLSFGDAFSLLSQVALADAADRLPRAVMINGAPKFDVSESISQDKLLHNIEMFKQNTLPGYLSSRGYIRLRVVADIMGKSDDYLKQYEYATDEHIENELMRYFKSLEKESQ